LKTKIKNVCEMLIEELNHPTARLFGKVVSRS
jgi:hypothetical protein